MPVRRSLPPADLPSVAGPLARNLARLRAERRLSLSALAQLAGVSKATLSEIERGRGNPSIETMWSIAQALGVALSRLFTDDTPGTSAHVVRSFDAPILVAEDGFVGRHLLTRPGAQALEFRVFSLAAGWRRTSDSHGVGVIEYVVPLYGVVEVSIGDADFRLAAGDLLVFPADRSHSYDAVTDQPARCFVVHEYEQTGQNSDAEAHGLP